MERKDDDMVPDRVAGDPVVGDGGQRPARAPDGSKVTPGEVTPHDIGRTALARVIHRARVLLFNGFTLGAGQELFRAIQQAEKVMVADLGAGWIQTPSGVSCRKCSRIYGAHERTACELCGGGHGK